MKVLVDMADKAMDKCDAVEGNMVVAVLEDETFHTYISGRALDSISLIAALAVTWKNQAGMPMDVFIEDFREQMKIIEGMDDGSNE